MFSGFMLYFGENVENEQRPFPNYKKKKKKKAKIDKQRKIIRMSQGGKENNNYMSETLLIELF